MKKKIRKEKRSKAKQNALFMNLIAGLVAVWVFAIPFPYPVANIAAMAMPFAAFVLVKLSEGFITVDYKKNSAFPSVIFALICPSMALLLRALMDFKILEHSNIWPIAVGIMIFFSLLLLFIEKGATLTTLARVALIVFAYGYGAVVHVNCYYDNSAGRFYSAKVDSKKVVSGRKSTSFHIALSALGRQKVPDEITVDEDFYDRAEVGGKVSIGYKKGLLGVPWYVALEE